MIKYLYHITPEPLIGNILYPLNLLKEISLDSYQKEIKKYSYREGLLQMKLGETNVRWNDVIHFSPVDISEIINIQYEIYKEKNSVLMERMEERFRKFSYLKIDIEVFDKSHLFVYDTKCSSESIEETAKKMKKDVFMFSEKGYLIDSKITKGQVDYFKKCATNPALPPYLFTAIPHVLYHKCLTLIDNESNGFLSGIEKIHFHLNV